MGPPKKIVKDNYTERLAKIDTFEYRWNADSQQYFLFNPYTGETIMTTDLNYLNRSKSMWGEPDSEISKEASTVLLYPEYYKSRIWGRRPFKGWKNKKDAATHIIAVVRGFLARRYLGHYFRSRYSRAKCKYSNYFYFIDSFFPNNDTSWYKPLLAFPWDIKSKIEHDPEDYMGDDKYTYRGYINGPYTKIDGVGKSKKMRSVNPAFFVPNTWRKFAISKQEEIELDEFPMGSTIAWFDGIVAVELYIDEYAQMRAAIVGNNWSKVLYYMRLYPDNILTQVYGLYSFSKSKVQLEASGSEILNEDCAAVMKMCEVILLDKKKNQTILVKAYACAALFNIFSVRAGRADYFNTNEVKEQGPLRAAAIEDFLEKKILMFEKYLLNIQTDTFTTSYKNSKTLIQYKIPTFRAAELVDGCLMCLSLLAQNQDTREQMALLLVESVVHAMDVCCEDSKVIINGIKVLYNVCYRCESGHEALISTQISGVMKTAFHLHAGTPEVLKQIRRLELTLKENGWRGYIEELIEKEMKGEQIEEEYLRDVVVPELIPVETKHVKILEQPKLELKAESKNEEKKDERRNAITIDDDKKNSSAEEKNGNDKKKDSDETKIENNNHNISESKNETKDEPTDQLSPLDAKFAEIKSSNYGTNDNDNDDGSIISEMTQMD